MARVRTYIGSSIVVLALLFLVGQAESRPRFPQGCDGVNNAGPHFSQEMPYVSVPGFINELDANGLNAEHVIETPLSGCYLVVFAVK